MDSTHNLTVAQIEKQKQLLLRADSGLSLNTCLNSEVCQGIIGRYQGFRERIYTPVRTLFTFIKQVLGPDKSCRKAVAGVATEEFVSNGGDISTNTGPYCKARQRLSETMVRELVTTVGQSSTRGAPRSWKAYGRQLKAFDGTTVKATDTAKNQSAFPQHKNQAKGAGFPILRIVTVMSLTIGTVIGYATGAYKGKGTGEASLLREIADCIEKDDIVLGDAYFPSFFTIADLSRRGADGIFRGQGQRHYDFRKGIRLGKNDHVVIWKKPKQKPEWMTKDEYDSYPNEISVREFKVSGAVYVTTFLDSKKYFRKELAEIYVKRWQIEINLKSVKSVMEMDMLSCKTPDMLRKEIGIHFLAYNFIRLLMAEACIKHDKFPWEVSFKGTMQLLNTVTPFFLIGSKDKNKILYEKMLEWIVINRVGNRPGRVEPRLVKQRRKAFSLLKR
ncbi:MAG TPA: IS4 family transposase, partial [Puia sp.]|nr:IS4 family transposase [Puia sp.]